MKILIVHQYYKTPREGSGIRTWYIARALQKAGHEVTVISGHNQNEGYKKADYAIHYFKIPYDNKFGFFERLKAFYRFVQRSKSFLKANHNFDIAYVLTTPLTTGYIALHLKKVYGIPYVFEVGDLWPEAPIQLGFIRNRFLKRYLYKLENKIYQNASALVALSPAISDYFQFILDAPKTSVIAPNIADDDFFKPSYSMVPEFSADHPMVISYAGAIGYANRVEYLVDAARICEEHDLPVVFNIMGDGSDMLHISNISASCSNLKIHPWGGKDEVRDLLNRSHAIYISFRNEHILNTGCPNKLTDGLAAGKMIIVNFGGWIKEWVEEYECGFSYNPENLEEFVSLLKPFIASPAMLEQYQQNAGDLGREKFSEEVVTSRIMDLLNSVSNTH